MRARNSRNEEIMTVENTVMAIIAVGLTIYLFVAMIRPEKF